MFKNGDAVTVIGHPSNCRATIDATFESNGVTIYQLLWPNGRKTDQYPEELMYPENTITSVINTVTITEEEYHSLIEEINMLQELVAELSKEKESEAFKPISEYTIDDWKQAKDEGWVFKTDNQGFVLVGDVEDDVVQLRGGVRGTWWVDADGDDTDCEGYTVLERIK